MKMLAKQAVILAVIMLAVIGCAQQGTEGAKLKEGEKLQITKKVWADFQEYLKKGQGLGSDRQGAFGVAVVGDIGITGLYSYYYCPRMYDRCGRGASNAITDILDTCKRESVECLIFARNEEIQVAYEITDD